jgi:hypothetical protein
MSGRNTGINVNDHETNTKDLGEITEATTTRPEEHFRNNYPYHFCIIRYRNVRSVTIAISKAFSTCGGFAIARLYPMDGSCKRITSKAEYQCLKGCK